MKKTLFVYVVLLACFSLPASSQKVAADAQMGEVIVKGKIGNINPPAQLWIYMGDEEWDTVVIKSGRFEYRKKTLLPAYGAIRVNYTPYYPGSKSNPFADMSLASVFFEKGTMTVVSDTDTLSTRRTLIKGSELHERFVTYWKKEGDIVREQKKLAAEFNTATPEQLQSEAYIKAYEKKTGLLLARFDSLITAEIKKYPNSHHSLMAFYGYLRSREPEEIKARSIALLLSKDYNEKVQPALKETYRKIVQINKGDVAPAFAQNDLSGKSLKLSGLRGRYVLIDFWASWCGPCRKVNPDLVKLYEKYRGPQFEILGVSLDESRDKWKEAIEKDGLQWLHVSDLKGWNNEVAQQYGITAVPQNFLLDKDGKVIASNLKIEDLDKELEKLINDPRPAKG